MTKTLAELLADAEHWNATATPEQKAEMHEAQRQSWLRSCEPCEHGARDWETCPECRSLRGVEP